MYLPEGAQSPCHSHQRKQCAPYQPAMTVPPRPPVGIGEA